jgi:hypothetical protein
MGFFDERILATLKEGETRNFTTLLLAKLALAIAFATNQRLGQRSDLVYSL